jgi:hypothetical protein
MNDLNELTSTSKKSRLLMGVISNQVQDSIPKDRVTATNRAL